MSTHMDPFGAQRPSADFADRVVRAMLEEGRVVELSHRGDTPHPGPRARRRRTWRPALLAFAAFFVGASAWAGLGNVVGDASGSQRVVPRLAEVPALAAERAESRPTSRDGVAPPLDAEPVVEAPPAQRSITRPRVAPPPLVEEPAPRVVHVPRCGCAVGVELCGCVE